MCLFVFCFLYKKFQLFVYYNKFTIFPALSQVHTLIFQGSMSYSELLSGLLHKGETVLQYNSYQHLQYSNITLCDQSNNTVSQRPAGICLLSNKRLLILSSQVTQCMYNNFKIITFSLLLQ